MCHLSVSVDHIGRCENMASNHRILLTIKMVLPCGPPMFQFVLYLQFVVHFLLGKDFFAGFLVPITLCMGHYYCTPVARVNLLNFTVV